jgi:thymidylate synthase (FAD)
MDVKLLSYTNKPKELIYSAARQCYSKYSAAELYEKTAKIPAVKLKDFVKQLISRGHLSPLEHVSFTFAIEGVSRTCTHQLVRHRIASFSQQSQRYVDMSEFKFIIPPQIEKNKKAKERFLAAIEQAKTAYKDIQAALTQDLGSDKEKVNQDARFILPEASETKIVVTMNTRELLHFFSERMCVRAQWEIRGLASKMLVLAMKVLPEVFSYGGAKCKMLGYCPENNQDCRVNKKRIA